MSVFSYIFFYDNINYHNLVIIVLLDIIFIKGALFNFTIVGYDASGDDASGDASGDDKDEDDKDAAGDVAGDVKRAAAGPSIKKKKKIGKISIEFDENFCPFLTVRKKQCSISTIDGAYCKRHTTFIANKKKDAVMAKNKVTMAEDKDTIATLKRELEIAAAQARQAARDFEVLALEKMMIEKFDEMMGKLDEMNVSSASK
ncbi:hypothetical protein T492DRAFT_1149849 [Pavlovales sp. CCMP2436]|nr:hypothetical protein T492DRAFT_1149849 [Pavlovales sp. CCMP2436]